MFACRLFYAFIKRRKMLRKFMLRCAHLRGNAEQQAAVLYEEAKPHVKWMLAEAKQHKFAA